MVAFRYIILIAKLSLSPLDNEVKKRKSFPMCFTTERVVKLVWQINLQNIFVRAKTVFHLV